MTDIEENWNHLKFDAKGKRKSRLPRPTPVDREVIINKDDVILSVTDTKGVIEYCNDCFVEISGYEEYELAGSAHNIVRHPDMPRIIFRFMWQRIQNKQNIVALVKNMTKTGRYYWVYTDFVIKEDKQGNIIGYKAFRKPAPRRAIETIIPIYKKLREIEKENGMDVAEKFLHGYLESLNTSYDKFIGDLIINNIKEKETLYNTDNKELITKPQTNAERKSFFKRIFGY